MSLKNRLLELKVFVDNEYLDEYIQLIEKNKQTKRIKFKTQKHHIIPKKYYKVSNLEVNESKDNIINLLYSDHVLAHYLLCLCIDKTLPLYYYMLLAFIYLYTGKESKIPNTEIIKYSGDEIIKDADNLNYLYQEAIRCKSMHMKGKKLTTKRQPMSPETKLKMSAARKGKTPWNKGKVGVVKASAETKQKMRSSHMGKVMVHKGEKHIKVDKRQLDIYLAQGYETGYSDAMKHQVNTKTKNESVRKKLSEALIGHFVSEDTKRKISQKLSGRTYIYKGPKQVWVNNSISEFRIPAEDLAEYLEKNVCYKKGRITKPFVRKETE